MHDLDADRTERVAAYEAGIAAWHAQHDGPAHLALAAIANCRLCDADGYRGTNVCDHQDHTAAAKRGIAAVARRTRQGHHARARRDRPARRRTGGRPVTRSRTIETDERSPR